MSNFLAIATVTATLSQLLSEALVLDVDDATVTTIRPDSNGSMPTTGANIFLYQVTPNAAWQNADLPTRRANGDLIQRPQAALDLHYLLTFYGVESDLVPQRVLGSVIRTLHSQPILSRELIRNTIARTEYEYLNTSNLADSIELVKFTPLPLSLEDLSKLWSVYFQTAYSLSIAYQGTVVLIESEVSTHAALPVRARNIYVVPFRQPLIEEVRSSEGAQQPITSTSSITILGARLRGEVTQVRISGFDATSHIQSVSDTEMTLTLPLTPPDTLRAGVQGLQVIQPRMMGMPPVEHPGVQSNLAAFVLHPVINNVAGNPGVSAPVEAADHTWSATVAAAITPRMLKKQRAILLLNQQSPVGGRAYSFDATPLVGDDSDTATFLISGVTAGVYLARVQVDGADSPLNKDTDPNNPVYVGPTVTIP